MPAVKHESQKLDQDNTICQACTPTKRILFQNVNIFDGTSDVLLEGMSLLVEGNLIAKIAPTISTADDDTVTVIDGGGRTLMPGLIAMHEHIMMQMTVGEILTSDSRFFAYVATVTAKVYLQNGFTSIRDAAGNTFALKAAIERGYIEGPRIFPSGPMISQSGGHADHRMPAHPSCFCDFTGSKDILQKYGDMCVVDGVPEMLKAAREALRLGATQIKIAVGGGTGSYSDPLEVVEFTNEEIQAAVKAAEDYQTYVMAHVYNTKGIRRAIDNGVKCIEHANLIDEPTLQLMKDKKVWLSPQVSVYTFIPHGYTEDQSNKHRQAFAGIDNMFEIAKKIGYDQIVFGSDVITDMEMVKRFPEEFVHRSKWFTPVQILQQATSHGGQLLQLSQRFNPGQLGVLQEGALADMLLVEGNPLDDISIMAKPHENFKIIMRDGQIYKNEL